MSMLDPHIKGWTALSSNCVVLAAIPHEIFPKEATDASIATTPSQHPSHLYIFIFKTKICKACINNCFHCNLKIRRD
jgi:hypothetical protein